MGDPPVTSEAPVGELDFADRRLVADYWFSRAEGELTSAYGFEHVLEDLRRDGAPAPILSLAERSVADEYRHSGWCREWAERFGRAPAEPRPRSTAPVRFLRATEAEERLLRITFCCFTETVGSFVLRKVRPFVTSPELRKLNQRHTADELAHAKVGWGYLSTTTEGAKALIAERLDELLATLRRVSCEGTEVEREDLIGWGYFTPSLLAAAHDEAVREVILPGLEHLGITSAGTKTL
ncbi:MAG TPA: hypothetical protein VHE30_24590 [Polyangiaceae bacterium]|nr:hypothetical protein [Polyangiaceae bacterium]